MLARNDLTGEQDWRRVVTAYNSWHQDILSLTLTDSTGGNETIVTTSEHPFYVTGRGWTRADALKAGDLIVTADGQVVRVTSTAWLKTEQVAYNMEVEDFHTYFVGQKRVWVHNTCVKTPFELAKEGGKHAGFLKTYSTKSAAEIQKGIRSIQEQIAEHKDKIANPEKHIENWGKLDPRQQQALLTKKWPSDIQRQSEQLNILQGLLKEKELK